MRHNYYGKHLGRNKNERTALFRNLVRSLFLSGKIETTQAKAKAIQGIVDKLVTQAKSAETKRLVNQFLVEKQISEKLVKEIVPQLKGRNSGYTSIIKIGKRQGDDATLVQMRLLLEETKKEPVKEVKSQKEKGKKEGRARSKK